jgi:Domain of unknown function (DUF4375)
MSDIENYLIALSEKVCPCLWDQGWDSLSQAEQVFVCVWQLEAEINNGGFDQFYTNSAGDFATETVTALEAIGAAHTAAIVRRANALFDSSVPPRNRDEREDALETIRDDREDDLEELDSAFYEYKDKLSQLLHAFVMSHRADIRGA